MKKLSLIMVVLTSQVYAESRGTRIIYGVDNRVEPYQATEMQKKLSVSTAGMINNIKLVDHNDHVFLPPATIENDMGLCADERFADQPSAVVCSGFLIGPDLLVTAGHCIPNQERCDEVSWVFDYKIKAEDQRADMMIPKNNVYKCSKVIESALEMTPVTKRDYALVRLDRKVENREILKYRTEGKIADQQDIFVIGHPSGLPTKVAGDSKVFGNSSDGYFVTNLDTFGGNSGSAVFNAETGSVEGILVRGARDYVGDNGCARVFEADQDITGKANLGESVSRITDISTLMTFEKLIAAIKTKNSAELATAISRISDLDMAMEKSETALHIAIDENNTEAAQALIAAGANLDIQNSSGETALHRAAFLNNKAVVDALVEAGANVLIKDKFGAYASGRTNYFAFSLRSKLRKLERQALQ